MDLKGSLILFYPIIIAMTPSYSYAIQPISDSVLSDTTGEQSPVALNISTPQNKVDTNSEDIISKINENLPKIEKQVTTHTLNKIQQPSISAIQVLEKDIQLKDDPSIENLHLNATRNFGLEAFSMTWKDSTFTTKIDLAEITDVSYSNETGQYELNNVRGQVWIVTSVD